MMLCATFACTGREDVLDAPYFHLVFTVPDILNPVIYSNQRLLYDALYHAVFRNSLTHWAATVTAGIVMNLYEATILTYTYICTIGPVIYSNQRLLYDALYHAASSTISELTADPKHLGAKVVLPLVVGSQSSPQQDGMNVGMKVHFRTPCM